MLSATTWPKKILGHAGQAPRGQTCAAPRHYENPKSNSETPCHGVAAIKSVLSSCAFRAQSDVQDLVQRKINEKAAPQRAMPAAVQIIDLKTPRAPELRRTITRQSNYHSKHTVSRSPLCMSPESPRYLPTPLAGCSFNN